ncbi:MAG: AraC family transcriptional regulator [Terriglobales bacterium]
MDSTTLPSSPSHRDRWLANLDQQGVGRPKALHVLELPGSIVQATLGEPPGQLAMDGTPAHVLMFNMSPVQALRQTREGRCFVSDMLHGEMTLMPRGVPSQWSWNSSCDRLDVVISPEVFGNGQELDVVDRFRFRDPEIEMVCRNLYRELSGHSSTQRLYVESLVMDLAVSLLRRHSTASQASTILPSNGLTRIKARRILDYIESSLDRELTLGELARVVDLSLHHFARMFKQTIGMTPHTYVLARRVERSKRMLRTSRASLVEIGLSAGFASQSHFTSTFHRMVGTTPAAFQGSSRKRSP